MAKKIVSHLFITTIYVFLSLNNVKVSCENPPEIINISSNQSAVPGDSVEFNCTVSRAERFSVIWAKLDSENDWSPTYISASDVLIVADSRISVKYDPISSSYLLKINNINKADGGLYACQIVVSAESKVISAKTRLMVQK